MYLSCKLRYNSNLCTAKFFPKIEPTHSTYSWSIFPRNMKNPISVQFGASYTERNMGERLPIVDARSRFRLVVGGNKMAISRESTKSSTELNKVFVFSSFALVKGCDLVYLFILVWWLMGVMHVCFSILLFSMLFVV